MWTNFMVWATNAITQIEQIGKDDEGQTLVEYALIIALVSVALIVGLGLLAGGIGTALGKATTALGVTS